MDYKSTGAELIFKHGYNYIGIYSKNAVKEMLLMKSAGHNIKVFLYKASLPNPHYAVYVK